MKHSLKIRNKADPIFIDPKFDTINYISIFLKVTTNLILYQRKIYFREWFDKANFFNFNYWMCIDFEIRSYLTAAFKQITFLLKKDFIDEILITTFYKNCLDPNNFIPLENYIFKIVIKNYTKHQEATTFAHESTEFSEFEKKIKSLLIKMGILSTIVPYIDDSVDTSFKISIKSKISNVEVMRNLKEEFGSNVLDTPWILDEGLYLKNKISISIPVHIINSPFFNLEFYIEKFAADFK